jgi:hypothetical protein
MNSPMTIVSTPAAWFRPCWWRSIVWPTALAPAPSTVNTTVKPTTNRTVERSNRRLSASRAVASSVTLTPDISAR